MVRFIEPDGSDMSVSIPIEELRSETVAELRAQLAAAEQRAEHPMGNPSTLNLAQALAQAEQRAETAERERDRLAEGWKILIDCFEEYLPGTKEIITDEVEAIRTGSYPVGLACNIESKIRRWAEEDANEDLHQDLEESQADNIALRALVGELCAALELGQRLTFDGPPRDTMESYALRNQFRDAAAAALAKAREVNG